MSHSYEPLKNRAERLNMGSGNKLRWRIFFHRSPSNSPTNNTRQQPPKEFLCPISGAVMSDPVIVSSDHTFERNSVEACLSLSFIPTLSDGSTPDFSTHIPNLALKSTILNWSRFPPKPLDFHSAQNLVRELKLKNSNSVKGTSELTRTEIELSRWASHVSSSSSVESVTPTTPLPLTSTTRPFCYSSSSSSDVDPLTPNPINSPEEEEIITKIKSCQVLQQEAALVSLRNITRTGETTRTNLCTPDLLSNLRSLMTSRYVSVQVNSVAALVNLSLENTNKLKTRSTASMSCVRVILHMCLLQYLSSKGLPLLYVKTEIFCLSHATKYQTEYMDVTFVVTHFNDPRISSAELRDLLLQSISVLVQYKEFLAAFERNAAATQSMPRALLSEFDNRSWIPVTNILLRLCKGSGFGSSNHGESSTSSVIFQKLLREACIQDEELLSVFLNRLFNTLSWAMTEFSISIREIQEKYKIMDLQQRKCSVIFDLSCNLARVLEFCTREIPQAFLSGSDMNLRRLIELIVFILNHLTSVADPEFIELTLRRPGQSPEKVNRGMILAPLAGIILNLFDASMNTKHNDIVGIFASMDCPDTVLCGFQYLLEYNWAVSFRGDVHFAQLKQLEEISTLLICRTESQEYERIGCEGIEVDDSTCCICYASEADTYFVPCSHVSCYGCISRHLLNCQRCFFCNATVVQVVVQNDKKTA